MSATGEELVTLSQLKFAMDSSISGSGITFVDDNLFTGSYTFEDAIRKNAYAVRFEKLMNQNGFSFQRIDGTSGYHEMSPLKDGVYRLKASFPMPPTSWYFMVCIADKGRFSSSKDQSFNDVFNGGNPTDFLCFYLRINDKTTLDRFVYLTTDKAVSFWIASNTGTGVSDVSVGSINISITSISEPEAAYQEFFTGYEESTPGYNYYVFPVTFGITTSPNYNKNAFTIQNSSAEILIHETGVYQVDVDFSVETVTDTRYYFVYSVISSPSFFNTTEGMMETTFKDMIENTLCYFEAYNNTPFSKKMYIQSGEVLTFWTYHNVGGDKHTLDISIQRVA